MAFLFFSALFFTFFYCITQPKENGGRILTVYFSFIAFSILCLFALIAWYLPILIVSCVVLYMLYITGGTTSDKKSILSEQEKNITYVGPFVRCLARHNCMVSGIFQDTTKKERKNLVDEASKEILSQYIEKKISLKELEKEFKRIKILEKDTDFSKKPYFYKPQDKNKIKRKGFEHYLGNGQYYNRRKNVMLFPSGNTYALECDAREVLGNMPIKP